MIKRRSRIVVIFFAVTTLGIVLYRIHTTSAQYIMQVAAVPYEAEAQSFYEANSDVLSELTSKLQNQDTQRDYYFTFQIHDLDSPDIPGDIVQLLMKLEDNTNSSYAIAINAGEVSVSIAEETFLTVDLLYGADYEPVSFESKDKRIISLDENWKIRSCYVLRG